ncbi:MAG: glycogen synthase GlgA [Firmicutes bacterium]|nr:glycogen synthase GlgA [Bacillota bacterium]
MKILYATSEAVPFIKSGGLADVSGALPKELVKLKADIRVILPLYDDIPKEFKEKMVSVGSASVPLGWRNQYAGLFSLTLGGVMFYFVDNEYYFKRKGIYGFFDDGERFAFFSKAVLELMPLMNYFPDVLHCNDWQTALAPVMLNAFYRLIDGYKTMKTVLSIHNIEFQGRMDAYCIGNVFGIPDEFASVCEYKKDANMLKGGIEASNLVVTVSPTYAGEILDPFYACGLEDILNARKFKLSGIVNGIDTDVYNPASDTSLFQNYTAKTASAKKKLNKKELQELLNLPVQDKPLLAIVSRLTPQKGVDLILKVIHEIMSADVQFVVLGTGDWKYENELKELALRYPTKLATVIGFSGALASKIYGAADLFLVPSKFEPCGLTQLISMRYGGIPVVRETGGLKDTVIPFNPTDKTGNGFTFKTYDAYDMLDAINRALATYANKAEWDAVQNNALATDSSWAKSAKEYIKLYKSL